MITTPRFTLCQPQRNVCAGRQNVSRFIDSPSDGMMTKNDKMEYVYRILNHRQKTFCFTGFFTLWLLSYGIRYAGMFHEWKARRRVNEANWPSLDLNYSSYTETAPLLDDWVTDINHGFTSPIWSHHEGVHKAKYAWESSSFVWDVDLVSWHRQAEEQKTPKSTMRRMYVAYGQAIVHNRKRLEPLLF